MKMEHFLRPKQMAVVRILQSLLHKVGSLGPPGDLLDFVVL